MAHLSHKGIPFRTVFDPHPAVVSIARGAAVENSLGWRPPTFKPTRWDYAAYEARAYEILASPRGRAAILQGGIIWRLALELLGEVALSRAAEGPSQETYRCGQVIQAAHGPAYYDDALSAEDIDIICGTYKIFQLNHQDPVLFSWWPRPPQWSYSGMHVGYWTPFCESWFCERLEAARAGDAVPYGAKEWRNRITLNKGAHKLRLAVERVSGEFLSRTLRV
ncbi:hypothetical protein OH77DRAFT_1415539 [Trametes cingulata]|nr:hypothetical protein OH77DRAFT_1415539 [Trametes cingulata]